MKEAFEINTSYASMNIRELLVGSLALFHSGSEQPKTPCISCLQVILAERKSDKQLCAIKSLSKKDVLGQDCADICMLEREILAMGSECRLVNSKSM